MARNNYKQSSNKPRETKAPAYIAYHVEERGEKSFWTRIGAAWSHEDGKGFTSETITGGRTVFREPSENNEGKGA